VDQKQLESSFIGNTTTTTTPILASTITVESNPKQSEKDIFASDDKVEVLKIDDETQLGKDVVVDNMQNKTIVISIDTGAMTLNKLHNCHIYITGIVHSSLVVRESIQCEIHCRAKQIRIHHCRDCAMYLHCLTEPIIEQSSEMRFGPFTLRTFHEQPRLEDFGENTRDNYKKVRDFNWLKSRQSPNWSLIDKKNAEDVDKSTVDMGIGFI
jgi:hypothetical protein